MKVYITKRALTQGIVEWDCEMSDQTPKLVKGPGMFEYAYGEGSQWHKTMESAIKKAEQMRVKRIGGLRKQILKLEALRFTHDNLKNGQ